MPETIKIADVLDLCWQKAGMIVADDERWTKDELRAAITAAALLVPKPQAARATPASDGGGVRELVKSTLAEFASCLDLLYRDDELWDLMKVVGDTTANFTETLTDALLSGTPPGEGEAPANERAMAILAFLNGEGEIDGRGFHERPEGVGAFWWRRYLPELRAALRSPPTGEGEAELDESEIPVRCTCEWESPMSGDVDARWPFVLDPYCRVHGAPGGSPEPCRCVPVEGGQEGEEEALLWHLAMVADAYQWGQASRADLSGAIDRLHEKAGTLRYGIEVPETDLIFEHYRAERQALNEAPLGVKVIHVPTEITAINDSKDTLTANKAVAMRVLMAVLAARLRGEGGGE